MNCQEQFGFKLPSELTDNQIEKFNSKINGFNCT